MTGQLPGFEKYCVVLSPSLSGTRLSNISFSLRLKIKIIWLNRFLIYCQKLAVITTDQAGAANLSVAIFISSHHTLAACVRTEDCLTSPFQQRWGVSFLAPLWVTLFVFLFHIYAPQNWTLDLCVVPGDVVHKLQKQHGWCVSHPCRWNTCAQVDEWCVQLRLQGQHLEDVLLLRFSKSYLASNWRETRGNLNNNF